MNISSMGGASALQAMQPSFFKTLDGGGGDPASAPDFHAIGQALPGEEKKVFHRGSAGVGEGFGTETLSAMLSAQEDHFAASDIDGDGSLTAAEIAADIAAHAPTAATGDASQMAADLLSELDTDGNGSVSADEFKAAAPNRQPPGPDGPRLFQTANDDGEATASKTNPADTNGDGSVSAAEMLAYLQGAANDLASSMSSDAAGLMQDLLSQLAKYGQADESATTAKVA